MRSQTPSRRPSNSEPDALKLRAESRKPRAPSPKEGGGERERGRELSVSARSNRSGQLPGGQTRVVKLERSKKCSDPSGQTRVVKSSGRTQVVKTERSNPDGPT